MTPRSTADRIRPPIFPTASHSDRPIEKAAQHASCTALSLAALGVVFGDIGTSPLYTLRECLLGIGSSKNASAEDVYGILALMVWALTLVVTVKYIAFVLRADHCGEGGIFALLALLPER